jgi:predicted dienelactone hydrolase
LKYFAAFFVLAALGFAGTLRYLWMERGTGVTLPAPGGPFAVGRSLYDWVDHGVTDTLASAPNTSREVLVWIWYPADPAGIAAAREGQPVTADYLPAGLAAATQDEDGALNRLITRDFRKVRAHSLADAPLAARAQPYPVLLLRGGASASVSDYTTLAEDLASRGYVVAGVDAPYVTRLVAFPDGRVMKRLPRNDVELCTEMDEPAQTECVNRLMAAWISDMKFVTGRLEQLNAADPSGKFTGRLDMNRLGAFGHSFGGAQAAEFCHEDARCKAGIDIDGLLFASVRDTGIQRPFMFILSDHGSSSGTEDRRFHEQIDSVYDRLPVNGRALVQIRGANHYFFADETALLKSPAAMRVLRATGIVDIDGARQLAVTRYLVRSFFDAVLNAPRDSPIDVLSPLYPEVRPAR